MKLKILFAGSAMAIGLGVASGVGVAAANAAPVTPGVDIAVEKPHHDDWKWGPGPGRGKWKGAGWDRDLEACISATDPAGYVSGYVCI